MKREGARLATANTAGDILMMKGEWKMTLTPAYGRDYKTAKAAKADFEANKDFILNEYGSPWDGKPVNKEQIPAGSNIQLRYAGLRKVTGVRT
jgi:hypothetical protein